MHAPHSLYRGVLSIAPLYLVLSSHFTEQKYNSLAETAAAFLSNVLTASRWTLCSYERRGGPKRLPNVIAMAAKSRCLKE